MIDSIKKIARNVIGNQNLDFDENEQLGNIEGWDSLAYLQIISELKKYSFKYDLAKLISYHHK